MRGAIVFFAAILMGALAAMPAHASCPSGLAAHFLGDPNWYEYFGVIHLDPGDAIEFDFAVFPVFAGTTLIGGDEGGGQTAYQTYFGGGFLGDADYGDITHVMPCAAGEWHDVQVLFDIGSQQTVYTVDGESSTPVAFILPDVNSFQSFRLHLLEGAFGAWFDSIRVLRHHAGGTTVLLGADFETAIPGHPFVRQPVTDAGPHPDVCGVVGVSEITWSIAKTLFR